MVGHECVIVQCSNWILDPITQPFNPVADRHVAQRNMHVLDASAGKAVFNLRLTNAFPFAVTAAVGRFDSTFAGRSRNLNQRASG